MKKCAKRKIAFVTIGCIVLTSLFACGQNTPKGELKSAEVTLNGEAVYPIQCDDTLTYWAGTSNLWTHKYENFGDTPLGKKLGENTGVKVEYMHASSSGSAAEQFQLLLSSDDLPDLVQHAWNNYPGGPDMAISEHYIMKLNDVIDKYAPALRKVLADNPEWDKQVKSDSGSYYAFPFMMEEGVLQVVYGPVMRADWLKSLNLEAPQTIEEWETVLTAFKEKRHVESPYIADMDSLLKNFASAYGVYTDWYKNGDKVVFGPAEPGYKELLMKMHDWYEKGLIDRDIMTLDSTTVNTKILNGNSGASIVYAGSGLGQWLTSKPSPEFDITGVPFPTAKKGEIAEYGKLSSPVLMTSCVAINTKCKNPELAARFLDYGFTEEGHNLFNFGIEGESYNWESGYPKYSDIIMKNPDGLSVSNSMGLYIQACYSGIMVQDQRYIEQYYQTPQQQGAQQVWSRTNMKNHLLPQLYIKTEEMDKDSESMANINTYVSEASAKFITGDNSFDNYDAYLAQLEAFGLSDVISFRQDALERYNLR